MRILLGVTGGIAAYKAAELTRELVRAGCTVQVVMTQSAQAFVTPLTFQALSGRSVRHSLLDESAELGMGHIELARWADAILIAPASANTIARLQAGLADDLLSTVILATNAPVWLAPAMNQAMWHNALTQRNIEGLLKHRPDTYMIEPASGDQACGDNGPGRLPEPVWLARHFLDELTRRQAGLALAAADLKGLRITITSGPTRERLDPVRYLSNDSSGKMGYALAEAAARRGADVTLISGPVTLATPTGVRRVDVESARDMLSATEVSVQSGCDWFIAAAAVADFRPGSADSHKMKKKGEDGLQLQLVQNPDILATVASRAHPPFTVGFAAETRDVLTYARDKLKRKRVRMIVANDVSRPDIGFNSDYNEVWVVSEAGEELLPRQGKGELAEAILSRILETYQQVSERQPDPEKPSE